MKKSDIFKVGVNWQVVIPPDIRDALNLRKGDYVRFAVEQGQVIMRKVVFREVSE